MNTMRSRRTAITAIFTIIVLGVTSISALGDNRVSNEGLSIMVLGSGGPVPTKKRESAGYLIFTDGKARILMDAGGGVAQRLGKPGVNYKDLDIVLLSHLHIDHMADISAVVKALYFQNRAAGVKRTQPIRFFGPDAAPADAPLPARRFDTTSTFIDGHFDENFGLERYLHDFAPAIGAGVFAFEGNDIAHDNSLPLREIVSTADGLVVKAIGVAHGPAPALAFSIHYKGKTIVYSGDTTSQANLLTGVGANNMIDIANNADLLIYDTAILDDTGAPFIDLHTTPTRIGDVARSADVKTLLLSHITPITEPYLDEVSQTIRKQNFNGKLRVARDLQVINVSRRHDIDHRNDD